MLNNAHDLLAILAKNALQLSLRLSNPEIVKCIVESYNEPKRPATRKEIQQIYCDIAQGLVEVKAALETMGFKDIDARFKEGNE